MKKKFVQDVEDILIEEKRNIKWKNKLTGEKNSFYCNVQQCVLVLGQTEEKNIIQ